MNEKTDEESSKISSSDVFTLEDSEDSDDSGENRVGDRQAV